MANRGLRLRAFAGNNERSAAGHPTIFNQASEPRILQRMPLPRRSRVSGGAGSLRLRSGQALGAKSSRLRMTAPCIAEFPRKATSTEGEPISSAASITCGDEENEPGLPRQSQLSDAVTQ
jgi:hypothetical protein